MVNSKLYSYSYLVIPISLSSAIAMDMHVNARSASWVQYLLLSCSAFHTPPAEKEQDSNRSLSSQDRIDGLRSWRSWVYRKTFFALHLFCKTRILVILRICTVFDATLISDKKAPYPISPVICM
jgi:hypothetical protein